MSRLRVLSDFQVTPGLTLALFTGGTAVTIAVDPGGNVQVLPGGSARDVRG